MIRIHLAPPLHGSGYGEHNDIGNARIAVLGIL
jgi:hypothetical protein